GETKGPGCLSCALRHSTARPPFGKTDEPIPCTDQNPCRCNAANGREDAPCRSRHQISATRAPFLPSGRRNGYRDAPCNPDTSRNGGSSDSEKSSCVVLRKQGRKSPGEQQFRKPVRVSTTRQLQISESNRASPSNAQNFSGTQNRQTRDAQPVRLPEWPVRRCDRCCRNPRQFFPQPNEPTAGPGESWILRFGK